MMLVLRYVAVVTIVIWIGGLVALGAIAAPSIFQVLAGDRLLAGSVFGEILRRFYYLGYAAGAVLLASLVARRILGPRPRRFGIRAAIVVVMLGASAYAGIAIGGRIAALQQAIGVAPSSLPETDPRRIEFGRLHGMSTALQLVPLLGGLILIYWEIKE
jgi:hypothetical protein